MPVDLWGEDVTPRKWQAEAMPVVMAELRKSGGPLVWACTGAGKSILQRAIVANVLNTPRPGVIVVDVPTQALVRQLAATLEQHPWLTGRVGKFYGNSKKLIDNGVIVVCRASLENLAERLIEKRWHVRLYMADEAHVSPARQTDFIASLVAEDLGPSRKIGVTATPYRSDIKDSLALWDRVVVEYGLNDAIRDGVLVPFRIVPWEGQPADIDEVCVAMLRDAQKAGPMLVNAADIMDAEAFADRLTREGISARAIHSGQTLAEREQIAADLRDGEIACAVHVATLVEGVDWPWLRVLCLRRQGMIKARSFLVESGDDVFEVEKQPGGSRVRLVQEVGRALRSSPGKTEAIILDPCGVCDIVGLSHGENIGGDAKEQKEPEESKGPRPVRPRDLVIVMGSSSVLTWISQAHQFAQLAGHVKRGKPGRWRREGASQRQLELLQKECDRSRIHLPPTLAEMVRAGAEALLTNPDTATKGAASDVLGLIYAGRTAYFDEKERTGAWPAGHDWWKATIPPLPNNIVIKK